VTEKGAVVFVPPATAEALAGLTLDAEPSPSGSPGFTLAPQD
jgi:hypothetical protein